MLQAASVLLLGAPDTTDEVDESTAQLLVGLARSHGILGPLLAALPESDDELRQQVLDLHEPVMLWCMNLELRLLELKEWFDSVGGIEFRVLKGPAVAHLDALDPSLRSFADIDLLIHANDMDEAIRVLTDRGAERHLPQRRPGFDRRFTKGVGLRCDDGIEIDIHRTLCVGALGFRIPLDDLFARPDHFEVGGVRLPTLRLEHRALHAAYHAVVGSSVPSIRTLRDLAGYLAHPALTPDVLAPEACLWGSETVLGEAVRATFDTLTFDAPKWREWLDGYRANVGDLDLIRRTRTAAGWPIEKAVLAELSWRDRAQFTWAVAFPSRDVLADRGQGRWARFRTGMRTTSDARRARRADQAGHG